MRELKFRAWDGEKMVIANDIVFSWNPPRAYWRENSVTEWSDKIMQFTGLYDKNCKEIYESDVCKVTYYNHSSPDSVFIQKVGFEKGTFTLKCKDETLDEFRTNCSLYHCHAPNKIEVIGNVFENPELL